MPRCWRPACHAGGALGILPPSGMACREAVHLGPHDLLYICGKFPGRFSDSLARIRRLERLKAVRSKQATTRRAAKRRRESPRGVGLLVVHGIGVQRHGQTVNDVMKCIEAAVSAVGRFETKPPGSDSGEIRAQITIPGRDPIDLLAREAYWDKNVSAPTPRTVLWWCLLFFPVFLLQSAMAWGIRHLDQSPIPEAKFSLNVFAEIGTYKKLFGALLPMLTAWLLAIVLAPIALVVLLLLLLTHLFLSTFAQEAPLLRGIDHILTAYIGDAWVYVSEDQEESLVDFVSAALKRLKTERRRVFVVAHSQGAEIARRAILSGEVPSGFVAVGSGENQLGFPRIVRRNPGLLMAFWGMLLIYPVFFYHALVALWSDFVLTARSVLESMAVLVGGAPPSLYLGQALWPILVFAAITFGMSVLGRKFLKVPDDLGKVTSCRTIIVRSPFDPVAFGQGLADQECRTVAFPPGEKIWREHVEYWKRPETGLAILDMITNGPARSPALASSLVKTLRWAVTLLLVVPGVTVVFLLGKILSPW